MEPVSVMSLDKMTNTEPQREHGDLTDLKASIDQLGLLEPLVVTAEGRLIAGRRRYQALRELGIASAAVSIVNPQNKYEEFLMALHENTQRKQLTWLEGAECALERQRRYEKQFPETKHGASAAKNFPNVEVAESATRTVPRYTATQAAVTGKAERTIRDQVALGRAVEQHPELAKAKNPMEARRQLNLIEHRKKIAETPPVTSLEGPFAVIYADPPWSYEHATDDGDSIENHYPTMPLTEICELPIRDIATNDCVLFLWSPSPKLPEGLAVMAAWGFDYRTCMVWDKGSIGLGYYARQQHELLLIGTRGKPGTPLYENRPASVVQAKRRRHSEKPEEFYGIIEAMYPAVSRVELFARSRRDRWAAWGSELSDGCP